MILLDAIAAYLVTEGIAGVLPAEGGDILDTSGSPILDTSGNPIQSTGGAETDSGWDIYKSFLPNSSNKAVTVFETSGTTPENDSTDTSFYPGFQILVRGDKFGYEIARAKMQTIRDSLNGADITGLVYVYANQSGPIPIGNDKNDRPNFTLNFRTMEA